MAGNNENKNFHLLCMGVVAFSLVAVVVFVSLGGGEGIKTEEKMQGFNTSLPKASVESVSEDRINAARREDSRRKREQMRGISGSTFQLLEMAEDRTKDRKDSALADKKMYAEAKTDIGKRMSVVQTEEKQTTGNGQTAEVYDVEASKARVSAMNKEISKSRKERYRMMQGIYGDSLLPDKEEKEKDVHAETRETAQTTPPATAPKRKGFNTLNSEDKRTDRDIRAVVHGTHKDLTSNSMVKLRLLDALTINGMEIPRNSCIYGKVSFSESRLQISVENVNYRNKVLPFRGEIYDHDGSKGIYVPDNAINDAAKDGADRTVSGTSVTIPGTGMAGQLASRMANNTFGAVKNAVSKKINKNKVTISDNYMVTIKVKK